MVPLKETPQLFRKCLTLQMAVDDRKLYVASKQSSRDPPFCLSNSAAVVSPLPAADTILHSFQHSVGRVLLKTCSCWLSACAAGSLGLAACVLWCAEQPDTSDEPFNVPEPEMSLCLVPRGVGRIPLQTCAVLLLFLCELCVTLCCQCKHNR